MKSKNEVNQLRINLSNLWDNIISYNGDRRMKTYREMKKEYIKIHYKLYYENKS